MTPSRPERVRVRSIPRRPGGARSVPAPDDLYNPDRYAETLLRSLVRAQFGVTLSVLVPAAAIVAFYPILAVLYPSVETLDVGSIPLSILILGFGIYPPLVILSFVFVRRARRMEQTFVELLRDP